MICNKAFLEMWSLATGLYGLVFNFSLTCIHVKSCSVQVDESSKEGQAVIGLQMGSNQGASQSGQNFGKSRGILGADK